MKGLVYAYRDIDIDDWDFMKYQNNNYLAEADRLVLEKDFIFLTAFGLNDDLREGMTDTIKQLQ